VDSDALHALLSKLRAGEMEIDEAAVSIASLRLGSASAWARVDHDRESRSGAPEIVYGESKSAEQIATIMSCLDRAGAGALATRVSPDKARQVLSIMGCGEYREQARVVLRSPVISRDAGIGTIGVVCAGTSDLPVAEEAIVTLEFLGQKVRRITDVGVAGIHRLFDVLPDLCSCQVLIVIAGMEGALPTVVAGLVDRPIIAVPTSVGYGVSAGGFAALAGMLSSCAPGVTVVNIDNGLGAAMASLRINRRRDDE